MKSIVQLIESLDCRVTGPTHAEISDIVFDSRKVSPGALFVAFKGVHTDGHHYVRAAIAAGARAILSAEPLQEPGTTVIQVADPMAALAHVALRFWDYPSSRLRMVGITGTNGKTTISYIVESIFKAAGIASGVLGTINYRFKQEIQPAPNTTPMASELQRFLGHILDRNGQACIMEVSSHALALGRVQGVDFDVAVFTNLTQDHLDFHGTLEAYAVAKAKLFQSLDPESKKSYPKAAILNLDDPWADKMRAGVRVPIIGYRLHGPADIYASHIESDASGSRFMLHGPGFQSSVRLPLLGDYNVMNALAGAAVGCSQKLPLEAIVQGLESLPGVPGRMERVNTNQPFTIVVDYAHTEDALRKVLTALRRLKPMRIITVFGCGGDRDRTKRPLMGEAAAQLSEEIIVTSDNPRSENPGRITLDIEVGIRRVRADHYEIVLDRQEAITQALSLARSGDIILIAGKGHENYQILGDKTIPFDDREVARRLLKFSLHAIMKVPIREFLKITEGHLLSGGPGDSMDRVSIDSRTLRAGDAFFALRGPRFDGHHFLRKAADAGASTVVIQSLDARAQFDPDWFPNIIQVSDTLKALQDLARWVRSHTRALVIGITGSNGKTTTKDMIASILRRAGKTLATRGNVNNHIGLPLTLCELEADHQFAVIEMGTSKPGDMELLMDLARPSIGLITNVGKDHLEFLGTPDGVLAVNRLLFDNLPADGSAIINLDDPLLAAFAKTLSCRRITYSASTEADVTTRVLQANAVSTEFTLRIKDQNYPASLQTPGSLQVLNAGAAAATALALGMDAGLIIEGLRSFKPASMRMQVLTRRDGTVIVNDAYNANPSSVRLSIASFSESYRDRPKWVVLGDMRELGSIAPAEHQALGEWLPSQDLARVFLYGRDTRFILSGLGNPPSNMKVERFRKKRYLIARLQELLTQEKPVILFKASRSLKLEQVIQPLTH